MKKLILVLTIVIISCSKGFSPKKNIKGYFFNKNKFEFYEFKSDSIYIYNFNDSILIKKKIKTNENHILLEGNKYDYIDYQGDSICIKKFINKNDDLIINKFSFKRVGHNLNEIRWFKINSEKSDVFLDSISIKINKNEIVTLVQGEKDLLARPTGYNLSMGLFFNKFPIYSNVTSISSVVNITKDTLTIITGNRNYSKKNFFKR